LKPTNINGHAIKVETAATFLGVFFDERLTRKQHIDYVISKCRSRINLMPSITGSS